MEELPPAGTSGEGSEHRVVGQDMDFGGPQWRSELPAGSGGPGGAGAWLELGSLKRRCSCFPCSPHRGTGDRGEGQRLEETGPGPFSICVYILRALQMDFFCDLTYFSLVSVLGLISSAGVHRSCLESVAAMATGDFSEAAGRDRATPVCVSWGIKDASKGSPFWTVAQSLGPHWHLRVSTRVSLSYRGLLIFPGCVSNLRIGSSYSSYSFIGQYMAGVLICVELLIVLEMMGASLDVSSFLGFGRHPGRVGRGARCLSGLSLHQGPRVCGPWSKGPKSG